METVVIVGLLVLIVTLLIGLLKARKSEVRPGDALVAEDAPRAPRTCPLCGHGLFKGQTVKSRLITIESNSKFKTVVRESTSYVFGCPFCNPANKEFPRRCPVCKETMRPEDYVIGRYFEKDEGKNHLHILGCTRCRKGLPGSTGRTVRI